MKGLIYFSGRIKDLDKFMKLLYTMDKKIVAVDIDNTLVNVNGELEKRGYDINIYPHPDLTEKFWESLEGIKILYNAKPIISTIKTVNTFINFGAEVVIVTSRNIKLKKLTEDWIKRYHEGEPKIYFTKEKHQLDADIYVEDDPAQITKLITLGKTVVIPEWPYNQQFKDINNTIYYKI
ncbi:hypothetical protein O163_11470 [Caldanaerobacter subterraneus subsp. yonseiensis KB-1]|uniref:5' nucleotidase, deoxy (Pyrimidine), cytosolic type C protein (NT5C) n=1 Tax=Caldanaerobacter subterraneus subsp. yonseiensis KB-1 TaxID=1388761 RepID=U5CN67_CALSX|nr:hypothetical protein [Caldanaerobacter subterraneus]ERM91244.1 hypothetical protein O163_11470 [Caldanaerobacter subterraneus subsp. yonseiensis KB-1]